MPPATETADQQQRRGILAGGNFITDFVKIISDWPDQDALASIESESMSNGGGPYNLLKDIAALEVGLPLEAAGKVGDDANGRWILEDCRKAGIDTSQLHITTSAPTSYTDAMTVRNTGRRTFFHQHGANATLVADDFDFTQTKTRIFHLGFLLLLRGLDELDDSGRTGASRVLEAASSAGLLTAADLVSATHPQFRDIVLASLPHLDLLFLNELEAGRILGRDVPAQSTAMLEASAEILQRGVRTAVVLHAADGAVVATTSGDRLSHGRVLLSENDIAGSTGAGDAFAAGFVYGWHESLPFHDCLRHGVCVAASSLLAPAASDGVKDLAACLALGDKHGFAGF